MEHLLSRLGALGIPEARPMFGGHGLRVDGILVALYRGGLLYVKPVSRSEWTGAEGFYPFAGRRLRLDFFPIDWHDDVWLEACRHALGVVREFQARMARPSPYRAYRIDG
jgi:hypothetical protein